MTTKRKSYSTQFKIDAVKLVTEEGYKISEASRNLRINPNVLRKWKDQLKCDNDQAFPGKGHMTPEKEELHRMRGHFFSEKIIRSVAIGGMALGGLFSRCRQ